MIKKKNNNNKNCIRVDDSNNKFRIWVTFYFFKINYHHIPFITLKNAFKDDHIQHSDNFD